MHAKERFSIYPIGERCGFYRSEATKVTLIVSSTLTSLVEMVKQQGKHMVFGYYLQKPGRNAPDTVIRIEVPSGRALSAAIVNRASSLVGDNRRKSSGLGRNPPPFLLGTVSAPRVCGTGTYDI
jgi:hypothetical protein